MKTHLGLRQLRVLAVAAAGVASHCAAGTIVTVPPGLTPGSQYRLVYVTADPYTATSSSITDYNNDVNTEAAVSALAALGTTWLDIGSTATVNAIDNIGIGTGVPIYDLEGNLIANDAGTEAGGLFGGTIFSPIVYAQSGGPFRPPYHFVWTGSAAAGDAWAGYALGDPGPLLVFGAAGAGYDNSQWIQAATGGPKTVGLSLYGISEVLTVPESATPEPSTTAMMILAGVLTFFAKRWVHGNRRATRTLC